jgi:hypothetical protein
MQISNRPTAVYSNTPRSHFPISPPFIELFPDVRDNIRYHCNVQVNGGNWESTANPVEQFHGHPELIVPKIHHRIMALSLYESARETAQTGVAMRTHWGSRRVPLKARPCPKKERAQTRTISKTWVLIVTGKGEKPPRKDDTQWREAKLRGLREQGGNEFIELCKIKVAEVMYIYTITWSLDSRVFTFSDIGPRLQN